MRRLLPLSLVLLAGQALAGNITIPLKVTPRPATPTPASRSLFIPGGIHRPQRLLKPPAGSWKLPEMHSDHPNYYMVQIGGRRLLMVLDKVSLDSKGYDLIYLDRNGNRDLTDDPPVGVAPGPTSDYYVKRGGFYHRFSFQVPCRANGRDYTVTLGAAAYFIPRQARTAAGSPPTPAKPIAPRQLAERTTFYLMASTALVGTLEVKGRQLQVVVGDNDCDGLFGTGSEGLPLNRLRGRRDMLFIGQTPLNYRAGLKIGSLLALGDKLYRVDRSALPEKLTLEPVTGPTARVELNMSMENLALVSADNKRILMCAGTGRTLRLPAGGWRVLSYLATRKDDGGNTWEVATVGTADAPLLAARDGATLTLGEPFLPTIQARPLGRASQPLASLRLVVKGAAGEEVNHLYCRAANPKPSSVAFSRKSKRRPQEASYRVLDAQGDIKAKGSFKYG